MGTPTAPWLRAPDKTRFGALSGAWRSPWYLMISAAIEPLLPPERPRPKGGRKLVPDRPALTGILFVLLSGIPWEMLPTEMGCGSGMTCWRRLRDWLASGPACTGFCWNGCRAPTSWIGAGPRWTVRLSRRKGGHRDRPEPDGSRQAGHQAACRRRWPRHAARPDPQPGQPARQQDAGCHPRCHPAGPAPPQAGWQTASAPRQAACRPVPAPMPMPSGKGHRMPCRWQIAGTSSVIWARRPAGQGGSPLRCCPSGCARRVGGDRRPSGARVPAGYARGVPAGGSARPPSAPLSGDGLNRSLPVLGRFVCLSAIRQIGGG
jgi:transposase